MKQFSTAGLPSPDHQWESGPSVKRNVRDSFGLMTSIVQRLLLLMRQMERTNERTNEVGYCSEDRKMFGQRLFILTVWILKKGQGIGQCDHFCDRCFLVITLLECRNSLLESPCWNESCCPSLSISPCSCSSGILRSWGSLSVGSYTGYRLVRGTWDRKKSAL